MDVTLDEVVKTYLADEEFQRPRQNLLTIRNASIPALQTLTLRFVRAEINLQEFRAQLERTLRAGEDWGARGLGFMMELNKLGKYHDDKAHSRQVRSGRGTGRRATQGSPPFFPATPAPTRRTRFPARFTKYLSLKGVPHPAWDPIYSVPTPNDGSVGRGRFRLLYRDAKTDAQRR